MCEWLVLWVFMRLLCLSMVMCFMNDGSVMLNGVVSVEIVCLFWLSVLMIV